MSITRYTVATGVVATSCLWYLWKQLRRQDSTLPLPPSLKAEWLIGHLRSMPSSSEHTYFAKVGDDLNSDIISFTFMGQTVIVLNSAEAAAELFDKRSSIYSDRPEMVMITDERLIDWGKAVGVCSSGPRHRTYRKMVHKFVSKTATTVYYPYQEAEIHGFLKRILDSNERIEDEFRGAVGGIIMRVTYGYQVQTADDSMITLVATTNDKLFRAALPSNYLVNIIPALKYVPSWMPGAQWKRDAVQWRAQKDMMLDEMFDWTKRTMQEGTAEPSIVQTLLNDVPKSGMDLEDAEDHIKNLAGSMFAAGLDTTVGSFMFFVLAMVLYPEVQAKAQAEIDQVIGPHHLPSLQDQTSLPYVNAVLQEVLRWNPVAALGIPHRLTQDDTYKGYLIPKGSTVIGNVWAITHNPEVYPDPETFDPNRFYHQSTIFPPVFGWGRRICPGRYIVEDSLFIAIACMLAAFTLSKARDEHGEEITPTITQKDNSLVFHPAPFKYDLKPRSDYHRSLISEF